MTDLLREIEEAAVVDFESDPIRARPDFPPIPCGVAIKYGAAPARYYAWGHRGHANPDSYEAGRAALGAAWASGRPLLFHNAKFDLAVAEERMGLPRPPWARVHDTLPALFLLDPRAPTYSLKPSAHKLLGLAPEERDAVVDWLMGKQPVPGVRLSRSPKSNNYAGAFVAWAPPDVVGPYCVGDVDRTRALGLLVAERLTVSDMVGAYDRERRLLPAVMDMEAAGVRVDVARLERDLAAAETTLMELDDWLLARLGVSALDFINLDSGDELASTLVMCGAATEASLGLTATGKLATGKDALAGGIADPQLLAALRYRAQLKTFTGTFMTPWLETASRSGGLIYTTWHTTRTEHHGEMAGARTGRLSSTPNFQNAPKKPEPLFRGDDLSDHDDAKRPEPPLALAALPNVRGYIIPYAPGDVLLDRDYSQQELRILGHYEDGVLCAAYNDEPWLDVHDHARTLINGMLKKNLARKPIKNTGFGIIYGMGVGKLAVKSSVTVELARQVKDAYLAIFPGLRDLYEDMRQRARDGRPLQTWGGRLYWCEPPKLVEGRLRKFDYKMLNILIQGSAADCTKEAVIRYAAAKPAHHRVLLLPHDEVLVSAPWPELAAGMEQLRAAMESVEFDVPMLSEGAWSPTNWAELTDYDKKGVPLKLVDVMPPPPDVQVPVERYAAPGGGSNTDPSGRVMRDD